MVESEKGNDGEATLAAAAELIERGLVWVKTAQEVLRETETRIELLEATTNALKALCEADKTRSRSLSPTVLITRADFALLVAAKAVARKWERDGGMRPVGLEYETLHYAWLLATEKFDAG